MNIAELQQGIKARLDVGLAEWGLFLLVVLVGTASFGLGRLSALEDVRPVVSVGQTAQTEAPQALSVGGLIVASKSGSVYYFPWCSGAQKIASQNQRWFPDEESARKAGYAPSKACKGLAPI